MNVEIPATETAQEAEARPSPAPAISDLRFPDRTLMGISAGWPAGFRLAMVDAFLDVWAA